MKTKEHFATQYIGRPWRAGARGPNSFDCWGLVWYIYKTHLGVDLPNFRGLDPVSDPLLCAKKINDQAHGPDWSPLPKPEDMCVVAMGIRYLTHVGLYLAVDNGLILHCTYRQQVVAESPRQIAVAFRFGRMEHYRYGAHS
jgi:cell wall-associated NlpC family hydrolase